MDFHPKRVVPVKNHHFLLKSGDPLHQNHANSCMEWDDMEHCGKQERR